MVSLVDTASLRGTKGTRLNGSAERLDTPRGPLGHRLFS